MMTKNDNKTQPTKQNVSDFVATLPEKQQPDVQTLIDMMQKISGKQPVLWGAKMIGFGVFHYVSKSGREGDWPIIAFAPGVGKLSLYLTCDAEVLLANIEHLGKYKTGKGCIYINHLDDVDMNVLQKLITIAYQNPYGETKIA